MGGLCALDRAGWLRLLRRWGVSVASLTSGLATLLVFRRGLPAVGWIVGYLLALWFLAALRGALLAWGPRRLVVAADYTVQSLAHGLLLFVLPAYFACTTLDGPTAPFFVVLAGAALLTTIDPWYHALVTPRPWLGRALLGLALFAGLNVTLALLSVPPAGAACLAGGLAWASLTLVGPPGLWRGALRRAAARGAAGLLLGWLGLPGIPPAPLSLVQPTMARGVTDLRPVSPLHRVELAAARQTGLVAYTPVAAPAGLRQPIRHVWRHGGRPVLTVYLGTPVQGGRPGGFRQYSRKSDFPPDAGGGWTVDVLTSSGQLVGRLRFTLDP